MCVRRVHTRANKGISGDLSVPLVIGFSLFILLRSLLIRFLLGQAYDSTLENSKKAVSVPNLNFLVSVPFEWEVRCLGT